MAHGDTRAYKEGHDVGSRLSTHDVGLFLEGLAQALGAKMVREAHGTGHMMSVPIDTLTGLITTAGRLRLLAERSGHVQLGDTDVRRQEE